MQSASGAVRCTTEAKVYIQELGAHLHVKLVEDSLSVLSLGRPCDEMGHTYSWHSGENPKLTNGKKTVEFEIENFGSFGW